MRYPPDAPGATPDRLSLSLATMQKNPANSADTATFTQILNVRG
jgi:hypothetical protein